MYVSHIEVCATHSVVCCCNHLMVVFGHTTRLRSPSLTWWLHMHTHMQGTGASPEGNRPFLDLLDLDTRETRRLWQSSPPALCNPGSIFNYRDPVSE
jgi:hypothetical protein